MLSCFHSQAQGATAMAATVIQVVKPSSVTLTEFAYRLLELAHRPEMASSGAFIEDANGNPIDTIVFLAVTNGDGGRACSVRFCGPDDQLSMASAGDQL
jgi:hypothetical protein